MQYLAVITAVAALASASAINAKREITIGAADCNYGTPASQSVIVDGTNYLNSHGGSCDSGDNTHNRVSCSYSSGIWVNQGQDNPGITCQDVASAANALLGQCGDGSSVHGQIAVNGGDNGGWFVEIGSADC